jgi:signal transduction histidine kinase/AraC-like DNA-binding protein/response regulator of citrate/malate metabolism/ABC-type sugar transport system substrate-binding protein
MPKTFLHGQPTIGVLTGWMVYSEGSLNSFFEPLLRGVYAGAREHQCHLLLACGVGRVTTAGKFEGHDAWPVFLPEMHFVPVGPWNTDGLIVVTPLRTADRAPYLHELIRAGHPVVFISPDEGDPSVAMDNAGGIRQALAHLVEHGHRRIAFISGKQQTEVDSRERLEAYRAALQEYGLESDPGLIVQGFHDQPGGYQAMQQLLASGINFTAALASNDESAIGAMRALREAGRRIPHDVALIGVDDRLEAPAQQPPLTSVYHPRFESGYQALELLLQLVEGKTNQVASIRLPTHLIIRQSCGCPAGPVVDQRLVAALTVEHGLVQPSPASIENLSAQLAQAMAEALSAETRTPMGDDLRRSCRQLSEAWIMNLEQRPPADFQSALMEILWQLEEADGDAHIWQAALNVLQAWLTPFRDAWAWPVSYSEAEALLHQARVAISDYVRRRYDRYLVSQRNLANQMSFFTARLLLAHDQNQILDILAQSLPAFGLRQAHLVFFEAEESDPVAWSVLILRPEAEADFVTRRFLSREFPPPGLYSFSEPFHVALLPLIIQDEPSGYVAFDVADPQKGTANLEPCAVIVRQLAGALKSAHLYRAVAEGRREAEAARQLAEEANQMKGRFLSTVSHELRTPLNLIVGLSEMLLQAQTTLSLPDKYRADVERIHTSAQHLSGLIRDVLDLASSETRQLKLVNETLDLRQVLMGVAETGEQLASDKGLQWLAEIPENLPRVWGDRTRLTQVVLNLVSNAVKFTERGTITLTAERMKEDGGPRTKDEGPRTKENFILRSNPSSFILVSVSDTGLGISPEEQAIIFDEFRQSERTTSRGYGGLGLGLAICKRLVELHGGQLGVRSSGEEGAGSTFYFTLPALAGLDTLAEIKASPSLSKQTVMVLVGRSENSRHLQAHLSREGFTVEAHRVAEATDWWASLVASPPGAVVLDLELASEQGWEILKALKGNPATRQIPVLFYSLARDQDAGAVLELDYLMKPLRAAELTQALARQGLSEAAQKEQKTVLVVDDDPGILEMHARMVLEQSTAHQVLKARNGREALATLQQARVDLVLLDLMMPEIDGFKVLERMREVESTRDIPVIVLTAQVLSQADMTRLNHGVATILGKGLFSVQETLGHVEAALARNRELGSEAQRLVRKAMAYLHEHYADPLSREDLARSVGVSEGYLARCFRRETGVTPMIYLNRYRVNQAKALLEAGSQSITEVALAVGFSDSAYFSNVFRREVGVSPGAYRHGQRGPS